MTSLLTNNAAMTALTTLKSINSQIDMTSNRVSTGQRVSNAADNAAYWSIATTVRTDNASLGAVKDSLGLGSSAVDTAYNGLNSIITDLQNMRAKLQTALQPGVDRSKVQTEITAIQNKMQSTADSSNSSGQNWLSVDSSAANTGYQKTQNVIAGFSRNTQGDITFSKVAVAVGEIKLYDKNSTSVDTAATEAKVVGSTSLTGTSAFTAGTVDFVTATAGKTKQIALSIDLGAGQSAVIQLDKDTLKSTAKNLSAVTSDELLSAINNQISASGTTKLAGKVTAALDTSGRLSFQTTTASSASQVEVKVVNPINTPTASFTLADVGFGAVSSVPTVQAGTNYANLDVTTAKVITVNDGTGADTITLDAAAYTALGGAATSAGNTAVNGADAVAMINAQLVTAGSTASAKFEDGKITFTSTSALAITLNGANVTGFGFTAAQTSPAVSTGAKGLGTAAGVTNGQGILDTSGGTYDASFGGGSYSVAKFDISKLLGTKGDEDLAKIINMVDQAIGKVTDSGTKLGASKTQIDGQKTFVDTLMKANDRTIGILVDADIEEESTKLRALQTQQQLAVQSLSIANSASQGVLSLFR